MIFHLTIISIMCYYYQYLIIEENNSFRNLSGKRLAVETVQILNQYVFYEDKILK